MAEVKDLIAEYLKSGKTRMTQIATAVDDKPWCCTVYYAVDDNLNLIWISTPARRHSQEIAQNANVAGAIVYDQQPGQQPFVRGVQFEGLAELLSGDEEAAAIKFYIEQLKRDPSLLDDIRSGKNPHKVYRAKVSKFVLFDSQNFPDQPRQEWTISA